MSYKILKEKLLHFSDKVSELKVICIGDLFLDVYIDTLIRTSETEDSIPVRDITKTNFQIGGAGTIARICSSLNISDTFLFSVIGDDIASNKVTQICNEIDKLSYKLFLSKMRPTPVKARFRNQGKVVFRADMEDINPINGTDLAKAKLQMQEAVSGYDIVLIADYSKGLYPIWAEHEFSKLNSGPIFVAADSRSLPSSLPKRLNILKKNKYEWEETVKYISKCKPNIVINENIAKLLADDYFVEEVLVTKDKDGMDVNNKYGQFFTFPSLVRKMITETSAGNAAFVVYSLARYLNFSIQEATILSSIAAACTLEMPGSEVVTFSTINEFILSEYDSLEGLINA